ncbi:MAG: oligosaccharide repeat unit polymerase [Treponema sp.]|nr:oligosaccharide repeat unit polymerase [Treponema sp.]
MTVPFITTKHLYLQKDFPAETEKWLRILYGAAADETLLCAVWTNPVLRKGFLVTDKALRWYVTANGEKVHGALLKDVSPRVDFSISPALSADTASAIGAKTLAEELSRLEIKADDRIFTFFVKGLTEEKGKTLCDILKFAYMQGEIPQTDLAAFVKPMPLLSFRNGCDGFLNLLSSFADKILGIAKTNNKDKSKIQTEAEKAETGSSASEAEADKKVAVQEESPSPDKSETLVTVAKKQTFADSLRKFFLSLLDVCASLIFVAMVVIAIKPQILPFVEEADLPKHFVRIEKIGNYILQVDATLQSLSKKAIMWKNIVIVIGLAIYTVLKMIVLLFSKNTGRKIVSALLVAITLLACFLMTSKFLLFIAFCFLIYLAFEYSCGFHTRGIIAKLIILFILSSALYIAFSIRADPAASESYEIIMQNLGIIKNSLALFKYINWM